MIQLYTALIHANVPELEAKNVLTELENTIPIQVERDFLTMNLTSIHPLVREQEAIRNDIRRLSDRIEHEVEHLNLKMDTLEERLEGKIDFAESKMDVKLQFHDRLLWTIIGLLVALSGFVVTNSILIYQKLK
jgi:hypothetical protein